MKRYQLAAVRRAARCEARYFAGQWSDRSPDVYRDLISQACQEFRISRDHPAYPRLTQAIADYADMLLDRAEVSR